MATNPLATTPSPQLHPVLAQTLPSAKSALALVNGEPGALPMVLAHTTLRAGIIGLGLAISGQRKGVFRNAVVASLSIEAFVLGWAAWQKGRAAKVVTT